VSIEIGFVLVTHNNVAQTAMLCRRLNTMFDRPPIALHHDFGQTSTGLSALPSNVHVVQDWIGTRWAEASVVDANLKALRLLYQRADPDWVVSLSSACYPIKTAEQITDTLAGTSADAYLAQELIAYDPVRDRSEPGSLHPFARWRFDCLQRYVAVPLPQRFTISKGQKSRRQYIKSPAITRWFTPFRNGFQCYSGSAWYVVRRSAAMSLLKSTPTASRLRKHYEDRFCPDESYYQTILSNDKNLQIVNRCLTYTDWSSGGSHPETLGYEDIPKLLSSGALFARKFPPDERLLQTLDAAVSQESVCAV
jgi:hypothetical protein